LEEAKTEYVMASDELGVQLGYYNVLGEIAAQNQEKCVSLDLLRKRIYGETERCLKDDDGTRTLYAELAKHMSNELKKSCEMMGKYQTTIEERNEHIDYLHHMYDQISQQYSCLQNKIQQQKDEIIFHENKMGENEKVMKQLQMSWQSSDSTKQKLQAKATRLSEQLQVKITECKYDDELIKKLNDENEQQKQEFATQFEKMTEHVQQQAEECDKKKADQKT